MGKKRTIAAIGAHPDDIEIGCGGVLNRFITANHDVLVYTFSDKDPSNERIDLRSEFVESMRKLGVKNYKLYQRYMRSLYLDRQDILNDLFKIRHTINPDLVFCPSMNDHHRDHHVLAYECIRAFKGITTLAYEMPWNNTVFPTTCFIRIDHDNLNAKIKALSCYKSQSHRRYVTKNFITSLARVRGINSNSEYAEAFEVMRWIIK